MRFTLEDVPDLLQRNILLVSQADDFVKRAQELKRVGEDRGFVDGMGERGDQADDEVESLNVLEAGLREWPEPNHAQTHL